MTGWQDVVTENARRHEELKERLTRVTVSETSPDGVLRLTVSADGQVSGLALAEPRHPMTMPELAEKILNTLRTAQARIPDLLASAMAETVGQDAAADVVVADARARFPAPPPAAPRQEVVEEVRIGAAPPEEPPRQPPVPRPVRPARRRDEPDDEWNERPVLEDV